MNNRFILHSNTPSLEEMTCIICSIDNDEKRDRSAVSKFHWQILKCRMLIFSTSKLIVSPEVTNNSEIIIIFQRKSMDIQKLQMILDKLNIKVILSMEVNPKLFESCYKYTLSAKLSPSWNLVETNLFISGRDFLTNQQPLDAIMLDVNVSNKMVALDIKCFKARLGQMRIGKLDILQCNLDYFSNVPDATLSEMSLLDQWIHVIPSMKKGRIISVNKNIPASSPFNTYKDLKRHWKNFYGYRLPESDSDLIYYEVHFRPLGPNLYTYPSICLRPHSPLLTPPTHIHSKEILEKFLKDLQNRMPSILSSTMKFECPDNFPAKLPMYKHQEHFIEDMFSDFNFNDECNVLADSQVPNTTQHINLCTPTQNVSIEVEKKEETAKIKPVFISKRLMQKKNIVEHIVNIENKKDIDNITRAQTNEKMNSLTVSYTWSDNVHTVSPRKVIIPNFSNKTSKVINLNKTTNIHTKVTSKAVKFNKTPSIKVKATPKQNIKPANKTAVKKAIDTMKEIPLSQETKSAPSLSYQISDTVNGVSLHNQSSLSQMSSVEPDGKNTDSQCSQKSKRKAESDKPVAPKKPKPEINLAAIDIPGLAMRDMPALKKLNAQTLIAWLRSQNIPATTRMLKQQLLDKVLEKLQASPIPMMSV